MKWLTQLSKAITYIEEHLDEEISYEEAANIACCSTYYFQRIFSYVAGITLSEYIRRRRMTQAAFDLQRTDKKVLEIALTYGYTSPTSFNRAFQKIHGISPAAAKNPGAILNAYPPIKLTVQVSGEQALSYRIEEKKAMRIIGWRMALIENMEENQKKIPLFWKQLMQNHKLQELQNLSNGEVNNIIGASIYQDPEDIYYYIAIPSECAVPKDMHEYIIPAATWVIFENHGSFKEGIQRIFQCVWTQWLPFSGYEYAGLPDIEIYPLLKDNNGKQHSEVWISIRKAKENESC